MKKLFSATISAVLALSMLAGCTNQGDAQTNSTDKENDKIKVVTTVFPAYDWTKSIVGDNDNVEINYLVDNGVDLHSFQPSVDDIVEITTCDVFVYIGGTSDAWVSDALKNATNEDMQVINLVDELGDSIKLEEVVEGMEGHDHDDHEHVDGEEDHDHEHEDGEIDEHIWLSLDIAEDACQIIADAMKAVDSENTQSYDDNAQSYIQKLSDLDETYEEMVESSARDTVLFGDRFPFRYLVDDYDIDYYAAFAGCSAETEASFETITFLAGKVDELGLTSVLTIEGAEHDVAKTIVSNAKDKNVKVLAIDSMQSTTAEDIENGDTYLSIMEGNLEIIKEALN